MLLDVLCLVVLGSFSLFRFFLTFCISSVFQKRGHASQISAGVVTRGAEPDPAVTAQTRTLVSHAVLRQNSHWLFRTHRDWQLEQ